MTGLREGKSPLSIRVIIHFRLIKMGTKTEYGGRNINVKA